jgi:hypothetical protein
MNPIFLLGAGFGAEAQSLAGPILRKNLLGQENEIQCGYPLVKDLPAICFPDAQPAIAPGLVEQRLADSIAVGKRAPVDRLLERLKIADYYLAPKLVGRTSIENQYRTFFSEFSESVFINFNYDSFVEFALLNVGTWSPDGGFGVEVGFDLTYHAKPVQLMPSRSVVLHPHGSLLVYTREFSVGPPDQEGTRLVEKREPPDFMFDAGTLEKRFHPFTRPIHGLGYEPHLSPRVIAPIPQKADHLRGAFVVAVMQRARRLLTTTGSAVAIGYAFADWDQDSFYPLIHSLAEHPRPRLLIVSPDARATVDRLKSSCGPISLAPQPMRFTEWVNARYPGLSHDPR